MKRLRRGKKLHRSCMLEFNLAIVFLLKNKVYWRVWYGRKKARNCSQEYFSGNFYRET